MADKRYSCDVDEEISELFKIKSLIEKNLNDIEAEKNLVRKQINAVRENIIQMRQKIQDETIKIYQLKVKLAETNISAVSHVTYVEEKKTDLHNLEESIRNGMGLKGFEVGILKKIDSIEGAINFYSEETLQMELAKRKNDVREKRVEYTRVESEFNDLVRKLEEERREREHQAELERVRKQEEEEERVRKKIEQDKTTANELVKAEQFVQQKRLVPPQPPNNIATNSWMMNITDGPVSFLYPGLNSWKMQFGNVK